MLEIVVLISGGGSNLAALIEASREPDFPAKVVAVGSDTDAPGLQHAHKNDIPTFIVRPADFASRRKWGEALLAVIRNQKNINPDAKPLIVSAGLMRILPENFVAQTAPHLINTHPALLPLFPGAHAVADALAAGVVETGVTVHIIDAGVDTGPVIRQKSVKILPGDNEAALHERIKKVERPLLVETVRQIALGEIDLKTINNKENQ